MNNPVKGYISGISIFKAKWVKRFNASTLSIILALISPTTIWAASKASIAEIARTQGIFQLQQGDYAEAIPFFEESLQLNPEHPQTKYFLGLSYSRQQQYSQALEQLKPLLSEPEWEEKIGFELGYIFYRLEEYQQAMSYLQPIVDQQPDHIEAHYYLALSYWKVEDRDQALPYFDKVIATGSDLAAAASYLKAVALYESKRFAESEVVVSTYPQRYIGSPYLPQIEILRDKLAQIKKRDQPWRAQLIFGLIGDSNVLAIPDDQQGATDTDDILVHGRAEARYFLFQDEQQRLDLGVKMAFSKQMDLTEYNSFSPEILMGYRIKLYEDVLGVEFSYGTRERGGGSYLSTARILPYMTMKHGVMGYSLLSGQLSRNDYAPDTGLDPRDGFNYLLGYRYIYNQWNNSDLYMGASLKGDAPRDDQFSYIGFGVEVGAKLPLNQNSISLSLGYDNRSYNNDPGDRKDSNLRGRIHYTYRIMDDLDLLTGLELINHGSSVDSYAYKRTLLTLNVRWEL